MTFFSVGITYRQVESHRSPSPPFANPTRALEANCPIAQRSIYTYIGKCRNAAHQCAHGRKRAVLASCTRVLYPPPVPASCTRLLYPSFVPASCTRLLYPSPVPASCTRVLYEGFVLDYRDTRWVLVRCCALWYMTAKVQMETAGNETCNIKQD